jgi:SAM-dependent methyltransferase
MPRFFKPPPQPPEAPARSPILWGAEALAARNRVNRRQQTETARARPRWIARNKYYYDAVKRLLCFLVEPGKRVLNMRCQTGFLLDAVKPSYGVGVDISEEMIEVAKTEHPRFSYQRAFPEEFQPLEPFDYVLFNDIGDTVDVQRSL